MRRGVPMLAASGYLARVDINVCKGCRTCEKTCPFGAIHVHEMNGRAQVDWHACMGCGVCEGQCPNRAIVLVRDDRKGVPLDATEMI